MKIIFNNEHINEFDDLFVTKINNPSVVVSEGKFVLKSNPKTDFFVSPDDKYKANNAPLALFEVSNEKPFCFSASISPNFGSTYDAGALFIYEADDAWLKLAFEIDELNKTRIVSVNTRGYSDDCNHEKIDDKSVFLKIASDTNLVGCYYSLNGTDWKLARIFKNKFSEKILMGLTSQSPIGEGCDTAIDSIKFSYETLTNYRLGV
ncbi:DUF1349 domain-containing protein [Thorsellia kenyensis]|uniref:DUF1349 domain-containing protein n=1 Tax=Thorsellia kenyensis TaxID=1549888 RepID=A0ABV6C8I8_9GAMM